MARVTILLGKGGTGRTTIARALALDRAREGSVQLLHAHPSEQVPEEHVNNMAVRVLDPEAMLEERVHGLIPLGPLTRMVLDHPAWESFLEIAPGIKEAAVLDEVAVLAEEDGTDVVLDGPATGHGLHFLQAPAKLERVTTGRIARRLRELDELLHDPERTRIVLVALPEELPARETLQLAQTLDEEGFPLAGLVVNRMPPPVPFEAGEVAAGPRPDPEASPRRGEAAAVGSIGAKQALSLLNAERAEAERWLERLEELDVPHRVVPSLPGRPDLPREVARFLEGFG